MTLMAATEKQTQLQALIKKRVIFRQQDGIAIFSQGSKQEWIFDFRSVMLDPAFLGLAADIFWERFASKYPFQVGGLESAAIPLVSAIVMRGIERGTPVHGFYIRKSRKPEGLQKIIEGELTDDPIVLVDDLINKGGTFVKQIEILKREGKRKPASLFAFVRFRDLDEYKFATKEGIELETLFTLNDFGITLKPSPPLPDRAAFDVQWAVRSPNASYFHRVPKSGPVIDEKHVYFGSDDGVMHAVEQESVEEVWRFKILGFGAKGKTIFSSPTLNDGLLYFGAYDGNFYALDRATGKQQWIYIDADWIGSTPVVAPDLGLVYVGLQFGLWNKRGGLVALETKTGKKRWEYTDVPGNVRSSPAYSERYGVVIVGSRDGVVYCLNASNGELVWKYQTGGEINGSFAFDEERGHIIFGSLDGHIHIVNVTAGAVVKTISIGAGIYSTPCIHEGRAYISSLDNRVYCLNLETYELEGTFVRDGCIFASPMTANGRVYVGSNDGRLYELDAKTGKNIAFFQTSERITDKIAYNAKTQRFFVPTYANELYCL